jgi:hypothetical protein
MCGTKRAENAPWRVPALRCGPRRRSMTGGVGRISVGCFGPFVQRLNLRVGPAKLALDQLIRIRQCR